MGQRPIVEHEREVAVPRDDVHLVSDSQLRARTDGDGGMLGGEPGDRTVRMIAEDRRRPMLADGFLADIEDRAVGRRAAHDRREERDGRSMSLDVADLGVVTAGEDATAGLELGDPGDVGGDLIAAGPAGRDDPAIEAVGLDEVPGPEKLLDRRGDGRALLGRIGDHEGMPFVAHQPVESQARRRGDEPGERDGGLGRGDSGALHAEVDVDQYSDRGPLRAAASPSGRTWSTWSTVTLTSAWS